MKKIFGVFIFILGIVGIVFLFFQGKKNEPLRIWGAHSATEQAKEPLSSDQISHSLPGREQKKNTEGKDLAQGKTASSLPELTIAQEKSLVTLFRIISDFPLKKKTAEELIVELKALHLKPQIAQDFNPDTGKMLVIRTGEALEGTRYFHAQLFEDENKNTFFQHLSFELTPASDSVEKAVKVVRQMGFQEPVQVREGVYYLWKKSGYIAYVKKMSEEDIRDDIGGPFNSYDKKTDVGTVRCVVELDIHPHDDNEGHIPPKSR